MISSILVPEVFHWQAVFVWWAFLKVLSVAITSTLQVRERVNGTASHLKGKLFLLPAQCGGWKCLVCGSHNTWVFLWAFMDVNFQRNVCLKFSTNVTGLLLHLYILVGRWTCIMITSQAFVGHEGNKFTSQKKCWVCWNDWHDWTNSAETNAKLLSWSEY